MTTGPETDWSTLCTKSTSLTSEEARVLEHRLENDSENVPLRVQLVGAGFLTRDPAVIARRVEHLAWLAEHRPDIDLGGYACLVSEMTEEVLRLKELWRNALARCPDDVRVMRAAAGFLSWHEPTLALQAYERAAALEPNEYAWKSDIAYMHQRLAEEADSPATRQLHLRSAESALRAGFAMASSDVERSLALRDLAWNAVALAEWEDAIEFANKLLESAGGCRDTWEYGNAIHHGHIVLGEVALARGDLDRAQEQLQAAAATPGSPQLDSFGPRLELAGALARLGRREAVIAYLESCRRFWTHRHADLDDWQAALRRGELPAFAVEDQNSQS
jgi:tetratricopeptide (TPR) repeat protein